MNDCHETLGRLGDREERKDMRCGGWLGALREGGRGRSVEYGNVKTGSFAFTSW